MSKRGVPQYKLSDYTVYAAVSDITGHVSRVSLWKMDAHPQVSVIECRLNPIQQRSKRKRRRKP